MQPGPRIGPVKPIPGFEGPHVCILRHVLRLLRVVQNQGQSLDQPGVVPIDGGREVALVHAIGSLPA